MGIHLSHRHASYCMPLLSKCLLHPLKQFSLSGILFCMTQEHCAFWQIGKHILYCFCKWKHTCGNDHDIIKLRFEKCFWGMSQSILVWSFVHLSHAKLVCSIIFFAFCLPKCT